MSLIACQRDPTLRALRATVLDCQPEAGGFAVALADTVLYPEGGGQPSDAGWLDDLPVRALRRRADGAVLHHVDRPLHGEVAVTLDWARRFDHMQQHSGQHLLSAVAEDRFGLATTAFHLGAERADVELAGALEPAVMAALEEACNALILEARPVLIRAVDPAELPGLRVRSRGLPEGHVGPVRLIEIAGVDLNTCGGTHVRSTAELGALKLLGAERARGGTRLFFAVGGRVRRLLGEALAREAALSRALSVGPEGHLAAVEKLLADAKSAAKERKAQMAELAEALGAALAAAGPVAALHRPEADLGLLGAIATAARRGRPDQLLLLTGGEQEGVFLLLGSDAQLAAVGPAVLAALDGRGGGRGRLQGKAARLSGRDEAARALNGLFLNES